MDNKPKPRKLYRQINVWERIEEGRVYLAQSTKDNLKLTNGLVTAALTELGKITAAGGPEKDPAGKHHQAEIKAMLTRAEKIAKRLPTKLRTQTLQIIQQIAQRAGITL